MPADTPPNNGFRQPRYTSARSGGILSVVLVYAVFAGLWILLSDKAVQMIFSNPQQIILASLLKGWFYVGVTSLLLYGLMQRWIKDDAPPKTPLEHPRTSNWPFTTLALAIFALTTAGILGTVLHHKKTEVAKLQTIADTKTRQLADWLRERQGDADFVQTSDVFAEQYRRWQEEGDVSSGERLQKWLEQFRQNRRFGAISLLDPKGKKLWGTGQSPTLIAPPLLAAANLAALDSKVRHIGPYRDLAGHLWLDFLVPLKAQQGSNPLVVLHIDVHDWLFLTLQSWPVPSLSGETIIFRRDGDQVFFLNELRHLEDSAAKLHLPITREKLLAAQILRGEIPSGGLVEGVDYRGVPALGVMRSIEGTNWFLVAKLDQSELYGAVMADAAWIGLVGMLVLLMAGAGLHLLRQRQELALAESVQQAQAERLNALRLLEAIAESSDDAIFAKDLEGRYILFNRAACQIVGKTAEQVLGRNDQAIFPADQAEKLMKIGQRVIAESQLHTGEENLSTAGGERVFFATKGPLRDADGKVLGLFGISRDITERKKAEMELRLWAQLFEQANFGLAIGDARSNLFLAVNPAFASERGYKPQEMVGKPIMMVFPADELDAMQDRLQKLDAASHAVFEAEHVCKDGRRFPVMMDVTVLKSMDGTPLTSVAYALDITARKTAEESLRLHVEELQRFNRAMVGRELEMIELKQQVNALCRELGQEPPYPLAFLDEAQAHPESDDLA